jgi:hypothetical protein
MPVCVEHECQIRHGSVSPLFSAGCKIPQDEIFEHSLEMQCLVAGHLCAMIVLLLGRSAPRAAVLFFSRLLVQLFQKICVGKGAHL